MDKKRCSWCGDDPLYQAYHDTEWGVPLHDDQKLFEFLVLESAQAGLSWITILKKREAFRQAYVGFDPVKLAQWTPTKIHSLMQNPGIIRNRLKIESVINNAKMYLVLQNEGEPFSEFLWDFVNGKPQQNRFKGEKDLPAETPASKKMSKTLKQKGFRFVGPTICYAFMQAVGMVNDHVISCYRYPELSIY